jgi:hypothetical protein
VITGSLTSDGVTLASLIQRIQHLEQKGGGGTASTRQIMASSSGAGSTSVFTVTGSGFTPNSLVIIKITAPNLQQVQCKQTAGANGTFVARCPASCISGGQLTFTAYEDANPTGTQATPVVTTCP